MGTVSAVGNRLPSSAGLLLNGNLLARFQRASVKRVVMPPGIASLNPGLLSKQPPGLRVCTPEARRKSAPGERSVASHRGLVNPGETHAGGVRGEIRGSACSLQTSERKVLTQENRVDKFNQSHHGIQSIERD